MRRRTDSNLAVEISIDVGTWSNLVSASYAVTGLGALQYPIGDATRWMKIAENLAALVKELDRTFLPEVESAAGPSPEWFRP